MKKITKKMLPLVVILSVCILGCSTLYGNGLTISNVSRTNNLVTFNIGWQNSWDITNGGLPRNYDAVWVFVKFRDCTHNNDFQHALLGTTTGKNPSTGGHTLSAGLALAEDITVNNRLGVPGGHNTGMMIKRATTGTGHVTNQTITLNIVGRTGNPTLGFEAGKNYDVRVFGIEMVWVRGESYFVGQNNINNRSFHPQTLISNEFSPITLFTSQYNTNTTVPANFPKGVDPFYCMKYEITQGQYADFLNTLFNPLDLFSVGNNGWYRYTIFQSATPGVGIVAGRPDRACNYLSLNDLLAYLDWACLRPMTELEYVKVCRGPVVITATDNNWFAWGPAPAVEAINISGPENGTETITNVNANLHFMGSNAYLIGGDADAGPLSVGIFARDATLSRAATGASFYGAMEMSGNLWEQVVNINRGAHNTPGSAYTGIWGNGVIAGANTDITEWLNAGNTYYGVLGGSWNVSDINHIFVTTRWNVWSQQNARDAAYGGRGVR